MKHFRESIGISKFDQLRHYWASQALGKSDCIIHQVRQSILACLKVGVTFVNTKFDRLKKILEIQMERLGVKLECDCQIVNNEVENRRKALANAFGADLGEAGRDYDFF